MRWAARTLVLLFAGLLASLLAGIASGDPAAAGGTALDERDELLDRGPSIVGSVRNVAGGRPLENARVTADSKTSPMSLVTRTDVDGFFRFSGLGDDFPLDAIDLSCAAPEFQMIDVITRRLSKDPGVPLEVECVMERK